MDQRKEILSALSAIEQQLKDLQITYEQYFAGIEKREPMQARERLARQLRQFVNRRITQTDLRFRYQTLAARFQSYVGHWDRILRLIEEGRYERHTSRLPASPPPGPAADRGSEADQVYRDLLEARKASGVGGPAPDQKQIAAFLEKQRDTIRQKFGDREVEFRVVTEGGKPKIKVRAKR